MTEYIANMLTKNMYMDGLIEESDESIYSYSIQLIIEKIIGFSAIYMIALFQGYFFETVLFTISLSSLRKCTGGYHANSFRSCFIGTVSIYLIYIKLIYPYLLNNIKINMIVFLVSAMVIFVLGAVNHPGMDWNKEEFEENKKLARITVFVELLVVIALTYLGMAEKYILFMSFGMILCAILLTLG
ncbi:accessory gene regulator B family protein, partial [Butyribacter intestini]|uniref:accessory gene regulator B family protein n=1 Tax=Butyribacter intestini TaxID=1703332 RepID=UPI003AF02AC5